MPYTVEILRRAEKALRAVADRKLYHRVRVGDHRIIYKIEDDRLLVLIADLGHRRDIYRA
jgi:mRNA interferase RelE/StbE